MLAEHIKYLLYVAAFLRACVQFAVRVGTCSTLSKAIIAFGVHALCLANIGKVDLTFAHILATLKHNRAQPQLDKSQRGKQSTWSLAHNNNGRLRAYVAILSLYIQIGTASGRERV